MLGSGTMMMKKNKKAIEWKSKWIDFLIVIMGITIAYQLNNWNEANKEIKKGNEYLLNFQRENETNEKRIAKALLYLEDSKATMDSLKNMLDIQGFQDVRVASFSNYMMATLRFKPTTVTMENIKASGDFELIQDITLRRALIELYSAYSVLAIVDQKMADFVDRYTTPFFFEKIRFLDFSPIDGDGFLNDPHFENMVLGHDKLLDQQISSYRTTLNKLNAIDIAANN